MKRILMGAVVLLTFALALTLTQVSCSKSNAQTTGTATPSPLGLVLYEALDRNPGVGKYPLLHIFVSKYDGTNAHEINITGLPSGYQIGTGVKLSPDGKTLFFTASIPGPTSQGYLYAANSDGSNPRQLAAIPANLTDGSSVDGAY